jgi:hypothetical protein
MALPTFTIRDLHAPAQHGVIDITVTQYDDTITSHPSSVLTYIDHDDGETVTVGSGFELSERLVEPAQYKLISRPPSGSAASRLRSYEKVHIFDIQRTSENLKIWRERANIQTTPSPLASPPVDTMPANHGCEHKIVTRCLLTSSSCCACLDKRPVATAYPAYIDSIGMRLQGRRFDQYAREDSIYRCLADLDSYCWNCRDFRTADARSASQTTPAPTSPSSRVLTPVDKPTPTPGASSVTQRTSALATHEARSPTANDVLRTACRGLETHIDAFAGFLDLTAAALQAAAQKTREADTTPIENLLTGLKNVLVEVGQVGMEVLQEFEPKSPQQSPAIPQDQSASTQAASSSQTAAEEQLKSSPKKPSINWYEKLGDAAVSSTKATSSVQKDSDAQQSSASKKVVFEANKKVEAAVPVWATTFKRPSPPIFGSGPAIENAFREPSARLPYRSFPNRPAPPPASSGQAKSDKSQGESLLMDEDASNVDFAQRYPPLISLKRARTIATLRKESTKDDPANLAGSTKSALTRYPSIGQLESRRESGSYPWRRGPGSKMQLPNAQDGLKDRSLRGYRKAAVEDEPKGAQPDPAGAAVIDLGVTQKPTETHDSPLPGAWPTAAGADSLNDSLRLKRYLTQEDTSAGPVSPTLSCRITSPPPASFDQPINTLRRAQTVTASNPAARLTGPFDPMNAAPSYQAQTDTMRTNSMPRRSLTQLLPRLETDVTDSQGARWANRRQRHAAYQRAAMPGSFPSGPVPQNQSQQSHHLRSEPTSVQQKDMEINNCVRTLKNMGYASNSNEESRLAVYAAAASGDVLEAIDIIEEERRAVKDIMSL